MNEPQKLLFVCTENRMRSLTAEMLYEGFPGYEVKSAGTELSARIPVTQEHVQWADMIFVMEPEHEQILQEQFGQALEEKNVICLNIPDVAFLAFSVNFSHAVFGGTGKRRRVVE
jgi:predicted protein tyrosine phosphatase